MSPEALAGVQALVTAAITAGAVYGANRADRKWMKGILKDHKERLDGHDDRLRDIESTGILAGVVPPAGRAPPPCRF